MSLVLRRALAQRPLVAAVVVLTTVGATLLGVCALLLGPTQDTAFAREVQRSPAQDVAVDAYLVDLQADDLAGVLGSATERLRAVLGPLEPSVTAVATSRMRELPVGLGYLAAGDGVVPRSVLVTGRWPEGGAPETTLPEVAAERLGLGPGSQVTLGRATGVGGAVEPLTLTVVGTYRAASALGWESDPLSGAGFEADYSDGSQAAPAYGPFVVDEGVLVSSATPIAALRVTARPDLARADRTTVDAAVDALDGANGLLTAAVGDRVRITRVASDLPATVARIEAQEVAGRSTVLVAVLLGAGLGLAALLLAGRLVAGVRDDERVLLVALGLSRRQQLAAAALEAALLAVVAALLALPAAALLHSALTHGAGPSAAGLARSPSPTLGLVLAVAGTAALLVPVLVVTATDTATTSAATRRRWVLARAGADVVLVLLAAAVAVLAWWQLRQQPGTTATRGDLTLTLAPVLCLAATVLVVVRVVPAVLRAGGWLALRSRALVVPLSLQQAARRPHATTAMVLVAAAVAAAGFGLGLRATWERSQVDQADLRTGSDLSLTLTGPADAATARELADLAADAGTTSSPVIDRTLALGRFVGPTGDAPVLVGLDSAVAGDLLRGRLDDGETWAGATAPLDPGPALTGPTLGEGATLRGLVRATAATATATVVVQDGTGLRRPLTAAPVDLDGRPHPLVWSEELGPEQQLVAVELRLDGAPTDDTGPPTPEQVSLALTLPGAEPAGDWQVQPQRESLLSATRVDVEPGRLTARATVEATYLAYGGATLLATSFPAPDAVPVVVSQQLLDVVGAKVGGELAGVVGDTSIPLRVAGAVPAVPSAPGRIAVLADVDAVSRALIAAGSLEPVLDGWWYADPSAATVAELREAELGTLRTRAEVRTELARGPLQVTVPSVLVVLVAAAVLLLLAGVALVTGSDRRRRAGELARLRALGLPRRDARRLLLLEHASFLAPLLLLGALVGAGATLLLAPLMVRSELGGAPVPAAVAAYPWTEELLVLGVVGIATALVTWVVTVVQVRAADPARLRAGDA